MLPRPRILTFVRYYLPGFRSGGPIRSISNMVSLLGDRYEFLIVTADRDAGDFKPYRDVAVGRWTRVGKASVFYVPNGTHGIREVCRIMRHTPHDAVYLNSVYASESSIAPLLLRRVGAVRRCPFVIAPRGELAPSAISLDPLRKPPFLVGARLLRLHSGLIWHASSPAEAAQISQRFGVAADEIMIAPDLFLENGGRLPAAGRHQRQASSALRLVFISRLSPEKNLHFLLDVLMHCAERIELKVFGPWSDAGYRRSCEARIAALPPNVQVLVHPPVPNEQVREVFSDADLFAFPSAGESFGHVIAEALSSGTPVLVSDRTPWAPDESGGLEVLPLSAQEWGRAIERWCRMSDRAHAACRQAALALARRTADNPKAIVQCEALFERALGRRDGHDAARASLLQGSASSR